MTLFAKYKRKIAEFQNEAFAVNLPIYDTISLIGFIEKYQKFINNRPRSFRLAPWWIPILENESKNIICITGRQIWKSTNAASILMHSAIKHPRSENLYVSSDWNKVQSFAESRLRPEFDTPSLEGLLPHGKASISRTRLTNGSIIHSLISGDRFRSVEGKSPVCTVVDELSNIDALIHLPVLMLSMSQTRGRFYGFSIGGEVSSELYDLWERSTKHRWTYKNENYRELLRWNAKTGECLNSDSELLEILAGSWSPDNPNSDWVSYHCPSTIMVNVPQDEAEAKRMGLHKELSVSYMRSHYPRNTFLTHVMGDFVKGARHPITKEMVRACMDDNIDLLTSQQVRELKKKHGRDELVVFFGADFGSGTSSQTAVCGMLYWRKTKRFQMCYVSVKPEESFVKQAKDIIETVNDYQCDYFCYDLGYASVQSEIFINGDKDMEIEGLGMRKCAPVISTGNLIKDDQEIRQEREVEGIKKGHIAKSKTVMIDEFISFIGQTIPDPEHPNDENYYMSKLLIPHKDWRTDFLLREIPSITRSDLDEQGKLDKRQSVVKTYAHPSDVVVSMIMCLIAHEHYDPDPFYFKPLTPRGRIGGYRRHW